MLDTPKEILDGKAVLRRYHNKGAFLNFGEQKQKLVTLLSVLLTAAVLVVFVLTLGMRGKKLLKAGLSLLLGGAFSNTYDRVMREYVVDYVSLKTGIAAIDRVVFNLADLCILIGTMAVVLGTRGSRKIVTVHTSHSQKRIFDAFRCFAALFVHKMALPSYPSAFRFSCKHGIGTQKGTSEL